MKIYFKDGVFPIHRVREAGYKVTQEEESADLIICITPILSKKTMHPQVFYNTICKIDFSWDNVETIESLFESNSHQNALMASAMLCNINWKDRLSTCLSLYSKYYRLIPQIYKTKIDYKSFKYFYRAVGRILGTSYYTSYLSTYGKYAKKRDDIQFLIKLDKQSLESKVEEICNRFNMKEVDIRFKHTKSGNLNLKLSIKIDEFTV